jgi:hypothetical protein
MTNMYYRNRYAASPRATSIVALEDNNLRRMAPSIFATEPYTAMSDRYRFVPTIDVVNEMRANGFFPIKAQQSNTRIEGKGEFTKHLLRFRHTDYLNRAVGLSEEVPEIVLVNSHDGSSAYKLNAGIFRLICTNGLIVSTSDFGNISVRHSGGTDLPKQVIDASFEIIEDMPKVVNQIETWKQLTLPAPVQKAFAESAAEILDNDKLNPSDLLRPRRYQENVKPDGSRDLWTTFNVVQENTLKGGVPLPRTPTGRRSSTKAIRDISKDVRLNRALWSLASKVAELVA